MGNSPIIISPLDFAREERQIKGQVAVADLLRLADMLADQSGVITWSLSGEHVQGLAHGVSQGRRRYLNLSVSGELQLQCQRCLAGLAFSVEVASRLELIPPGQPWPEDELEDDSCDAIEAPAEMDVLSLVEEEILLALPPAPRHEVCAPPGVRHEAGEQAQAEPKKPSPFAVLAGLKRHDS